MTEAAPTGDIAEPEESASVAAAPTVSLPPRRQHPAYIIISAVRSLRALAFPLLILLLGGGRDGNSVILGFGAAAALIGVASRALAWWQFRYEVSNGELRVHSGVLARQDRFVPLERIQALDTGETPLQRLFGVVGVRIETAAGGAAASDVRLDAITGAEADLLRASLAVAPTGSPAAGDAARASTATVDGSDRGELIRTLSRRELLVAGATSGRIGPALAVVSFGFQLIDDIVPERLWERVAMQAPGLTFRGIIAAALVFGLAAWLLAVGSTLLTYSGFEVRRGGDRLFVSYGLLDRRRSTIPLNRVQAVTIFEGMLRQPFGLASIRVESAGYGRDAAGSGMLFPLLRRADVADLLAQTVPAFASAAALDRDALSPLPRRALSRYVLGGVWGVLGLTAVALAIAALVPSVNWRWGLAPLIFLPFAALLGLLRFRDTGWAIDDAARLIARGRIVARTTTIAPRRRLQRREVVRGPLQRRARLATFRFAVAAGGRGGQTEIEHLDEAAAFALLEQLGPTVRHRTSPRPGPAASPGAAPDLSSLNQA